MIAEEFRHSECCDPVHVQSQVTREMLLPEERAYFDGLKEAEYREKYLSERSALSGAKDAHARTVKFIARMRVAKCPYAEVNRSDRKPVALAAEDREKKSGLKDPKLSDETLTKTADKVLEVLGYTREDIARKGERLRRGIAMLVMIELGCKLDEAIIGLGLKQDGALIAMRCAREFADAMETVRVAVMRVGYYVRGESDRATLERRRIARRRERQECRLPG